MTSSARASMDSGIFQAEHLSGLHIDYELELSWLLYRKLSGPGNRARGDPMRCVSVHRAMTPPSLTGL
jgi:hypothetical protein